MRSLQSINRLDKNDLLLFALTAISVFGLLCKLPIALRLNLNSDSVVPGLQAMEIFRHGNTLLSGFYFNQNYPAVFIDLVPFHLLPQLLSGYDPGALRLTGFFIFILILLVYTALVYRVTKDRVKSLLFLALLANITPGAYIYYIVPVAHATTILFTGVLLFVLLEYEKLRPYQMGSAAIAVFLLAFSDNLALVIMALPFALLVIYEGIRKEKSVNTKAIFPATAILLPGLAGYIVKLFLPMMVSMDIDLLAINTSLQDAGMSLYDKLSSYVYGVAIVINDHIYSLLSGHIGILEVSGLALAVLFLYSLWGFLKRHDDRPFLENRLLLLLLAANILLFLGAVLTSLNSSRYLLFVAISIFVIVALGYDRSKVYLALAAIVVISGMAGSAITAIDASPGSNSEEIGLIGFLEENNMTVGYAGYWDSNILTYLSNEKVKVRAVGYNSGKLVQYKLLSSSTWYEDKPTHFFLLYHMGHDYGDIGAIASAIEWDNMLKYDDYYIFVYDMDQSPLLNNY